MKKELGSSFHPEATPSFWVNQASRLILRLFEQRLRPLGFGMAYVPVAMALEQDGALLQKDLAARACVEQPTMAALLARMERDALITRVAHPSDKRASLISLTAQAKSRLPKVKKQLDEGAELALTGFSESERTMLITLLRRVVANLAGPEER